MVAIGAAVSAAISVVVFSPVATATPVETCWDGSHAGRVSVEKNNWFDDHVDYSAKWHWCGVDGKVTKFIVDNTTPAPDITPVYVDIQPQRPLDFGDSTFPIYVKGIAGKKSNYDDITLKADGQMIVACRPGTVRYEGECYGEEYLNGKPLWGGKTVVECADEATRKAVKKILDEQKATEVAKQGGKQLGKKLLAVPSIFKCMLWDT